MAKRLRELGLHVERQKPVQFRFDDIDFEEGFRADLLVEGVLLVELKSIERLLPVNAKQVLTYLRLLDLKLGMLINFGGATFREGVRRIVNNHTDTSSSRLRIHAQSQD